MNYFNVYLLYLKCDIFISNSRYQISIVTLYIFHYMKLTKKSMAVLEEGMAMFHFL